MHARAGECMCVLARVSLMKWREGLALQDGGAADAVQGSEPRVNWV